MRARHFFGRQFEHSGREILSVNGAALFIQPCRQHGSSKPNVQHRSVWGLHDSLKNCGKYLLTDTQKVVFLSALRGCLNENGKILIGDVAFETRDALNRCRQEAGAHWDDDEIYFVAEEIKKDFPDLLFTQLSPCAGVLTISK